MPILDLHAEDLGAAALNSRVEPPPAADPGMFKGFAEGTGRYFMRGMAETGRAASMAFGAAPVLLQKAVDAIDPGGRINDKRLDDSYFKAHDEFFGSAVDYWTPKPGEVGAAGQVVGSLGAGVVQFLANPALMIGTQQLSVSEDLVRQGIDVGPALVAGDIAGLGAVAGIALPILGNTLGQRVATGVAGNLGQGIATAGATRAVLGAADAPAGVLAQFDPWDVRNRSVDALMGIAFGGLAHVTARPQLSQTQRDAIMLVNQARHIEEASSPGHPVDAAIDNTRRALDQMLRGEPVSVDAEVPRGAPDPAKDAQRAEIARVVEDSMTREPAIERPPEIVVPAPKPEPAPAPEPAPSFLRTTVESTAQQMVGKEPGQLVAELKRAGTLTPLLNNTIVGLAESGGDPARVAALVAHAEALAQQAPGRPIGDVMADAIDRMRSGEPVPARPDAAPAARPAPDVPRFADDVTMPDGRKANDFVAAEQASAETTRATAKNLFAAVANCLIGGA